MDRTALEDALMRLRSLDVGIETAVSQLRHLMIELSRMRLPLTERSDAHGLYCATFRSGGIVAMIEGTAIDPVESWELQTRTAKLSRSEARAFAHWILHELERPAGAREHQNDQAGE